MSKPRQTARVRQPDPPAPAIEIGSRWADKDPRRGTGKLPPRHLVVIALEIDQRTGRLWRVQTRCEESGVVTWSAVKRFGVACGLKPAPLPTDPTEGPAT